MVERSRMLGMDPQNHVRVINHKVCSGVSCCGIPRAKQDAHHPWESHRCSHTAYSGVSIDRVQVVPSPKLHQRYTRGQTLPYLRTSPWIRPHDSNCSGPTPITGSGRHLASDRQASLHEPDRISSSLPRRKAQLVRLGRRVHDREQTSVSRDAQKAARNTSTTTMQPGRSLELTMIAERTPSRIGDPECKTAKSPPMLSRQPSGSSKGSASSTAPSTRSTIRWEALVSMSVALDQVQKRIHGHGTTGACLHFPRAFRNNLTSHSSQGTNMTTRDKHDTHIYRVVHLQFDFPGFTKSTSRSPFWGGSLRHIPTGPLAPP